MGVIYFITPLIFERPGGEFDQVDSTFTLDPYEFADALKKRWQDVEVDFSSDRFLLYWHCKIKEDHGLRGSKGNSPGVVLEKPGEFDAAEFAVWYRSIIPSQYRLSIWNDVDFLEKNLELRSDTTYFQVLHFFSELDYIPTIASFDDVNFKISHEHFVSKLKEQWPAITILPVQAGDPYWLYWEIPDPKWGNLQAGMFDRDQATVMLHYFPDEQVAQFAVWYRSITPEEHKLIISIKAKNRSLILEKSTTEQDVINALKPMFL